MIGEFGSAEEDSSLDLIREAMNCYQAPDQTVYNILSNIYFALHELGAFCLICEDASQDI